MVLGSQSAGLRESFISKTVLVCAGRFDGLTDTLAGRAEILIENGVMSPIGTSISHHRNTAPVVQDVLASNVL
jgi:hypothetical protein